MPTYEYECQRCGKNFEFFQSITDKPLDKCSYCNGEVKRLIGRGSGIIFKGSGFYATDYRKGDAQCIKSKEPPTCPAKESGSCSGCTDKD